MARTKSRSRMQKLAEKVFRFAVELETPEGGFGHRFRDMEEWPAARGLEGWLEKHGRDSAGRWFMFGATFYFADAETAEAFRAEFGGKQRSSSRPN
ncbi:hypothetical protein [Nisaea nitritireducens]|uniref:hypothetical protein n=1 Tax=Nisaea nitritireducens TaxID=568392 RepID=UPI001868C049|nr:hypothetical protein [Nisaea nitritireducens]